MKSISLIPPESRTTQGTVVPKNILLLLAIVGLIIIGGAAYAYSLNTSITNSKNSATMTNASLQPLSDTVNSLIVKSSVNNSNANIPALKALIQQIDHQRPSWSNIIQQIYTIAGGSVQITSFNGQLPVNASSSTAATSGAFDINIAGVATSQVTMVDFIQRLRRASGISQAVLLSSTQAQATSGKGAGVNFTAGLALSSDKQQLIFAPTIGGTSSVAPSAVGAG